MNTRAAAIILAHNTQTDIRSSCTVREFNSQNEEANENEGFENDNVIERLDMSGNLIM